jgi:hypothetical protein
MGYRFCSGFDRDGSGEWGDIIGGARFQIISPTYPTRVFYICHLSSVILHFMIHGRAWSRAHES